MKNAKKLLADLGVTNCTSRHLSIIGDFITNEETNIESLLNQLGGWDDTDLKIAKRWLESD